MDSMISISQILDLVGKLDDSSGEGTARERFRSYLNQNIDEVGQVRDYIYECLRNTEPQYHRALQDLVNHLGTFLGFEVEYGRYQGVQGEIGYDGLWSSPNGFNLVIEVKKSESFAIEIPTLLGYIDQLVSAGRITDRDAALGIYVLGKPNPNIRQIENAIIAQSHSNRLRIISVDSLITIAELMNEYDINHDNILGLLRPSVPRIDSVIDLIARIVAEAAATDIVAPPSPEPSVESPERTFYCTPVTSDDNESAEECINKLVGENKIYAFGNRTPGRKHIKPGDMICFYATGIGVVAQAEVSTRPVEEDNPFIQDSNRYPWVFQIKDSQLFLDNPIIIDAQLRSKLDAFSGRDPNRPWAWFVQATRKISKHDYQILTNHNTTLE